MPTTDTVIRNPALSIASVDQLFAELLDRLEREKRDAADSIRPDSPYRTLINSCAMLARLRDWHKAAFGA